MGVNGLIDKLTISPISPRKVDVFPAGVKEEEGGNGGKMVQFKTVGNLEGNRDYETI